MLLLIGVYALEAIDGSTCNFERVMTSKLLTYGDGPVRLKRPDDEERCPARAPVRRANRQTAKLRARIERAVSAGQSHRAMGLQHLLLRSRSARLSAVAEVNRSLKGAERARSDELVQIATRTDMFGSADEEVKLVAADKPNGGWRPITIFGLERAARQKLACWAIQPFHVSDPRQFALTGGGHNEAGRYVCQALDDGHTWFAGLDITSFYSSIDGNRLYELIPLPNKVIEHVIVADTGAPVRIAHAGRALAGIRLVQASQSGISQGSRSSPLVAEIIVKDILSRLSLDGRVVNVADDFGVMARSKREVIAIQKALTRAVARCPAGCFQLRPKAHPRPRRACDGFEFLGYHFRKSPTVRCLISEQNVDRFNQRVLRYWMRAEAGKPDAIPSLRRYVQRWWGSFPLIPASLRDPTVRFGRDHARRVGLHYKRSLLPLIDVAMAWDGANYAPLPSALEMGELARSIRRRNPPHRSRVPHWR